MKEEKVNHSRRGVRQDAVTTCRMARICNIFEDSATDTSWQLLFALVLRLQATVSEYGKNLQDCKMEVLVGVRQQHSQLELELSGQLYLFSHHMYALASIYGRWGCRMCAITFSFQWVAVGVRCRRASTFLTTPGLLGHWFPLCFGNVNDISSF